MEFFTIPNFCYLCRLILKSDDTNIDTGYLFYLHSSSFCCYMVHSQKSQQPVVLHREQGLSLVCCGLRHDRGIAFGGHIHVGPPEMHPQNPVSQKLHGKAIHIFNDFPARLDPFRAKSPVLSLGGRVNTCLARQKTSPGWTLQKCLLKVESRAYGNMCALINLRQRKRRNRSFPRQ